MKQSLLTAGGDEKGSKNGGVHIRKVADRSIKWPLKHHEKCAYGARFSLDEQYIVTCGSNNKVNVYHIRHNLDIAQPTGFEYLGADVPTRTVRCIAIHKQYLAIGGLGETKIGEKMEPTGEIRIMDLSKNEPAKSAVRINFGAGELTSIAFDHEGKFLAAVSDNEVGAWQLNWLSGNHQLFTRKKEDKKPTALCFDPKSSAVFLATEETPVSKIDFEPSDPNTSYTMSAFPPARLESIGGQSFAKALALSPDGSRLAAACNDGCVRIFDAMDGSFLLALRQSSKPLTAIAFSHDGRSLATGCVDGKVRIWETVD